MLYVLDTETASLQGGVCDIAIVALDENLNITWQVESLIDPEVPISPGASGVHGIVDEDVWDKPTLSEFMEMHGWPLHRDDLIVAGHNVQFDCRMLADVLPQRYGKVCTLRIAKNLWPDNPDHKLQTLRYQFKLEAGPAHRAMGDVITCVSLLRMVADLKGCGLDGLIDLGSRPLSPETRIGFGKHKGTKLKSLPRDYVRWLLRQENVDADLRDALEATLTQTATTG